MVLLSEKRMSRREELLRVFEQVRSLNSAVAGLRLCTFVETEAACEAAAELGVPVIIMVSLERPGLEAFVRALRSLDGNVFVELVSEDPKLLARAACELETDAVYLIGGGREAAETLFSGLGDTPVVTEIVLPWREAAPGQRWEGRIVDIEEARKVLELEKIDVAAVPVGGGPGPYKSWRIPLWTLELFNEAAAIRGDVFYSLPWGSLLPKELLKQYNLYGGALPGVISLPNHQYRSFVAAGAVKVTFRSDCALAFLGGMRESFTKQPEVIDVGVHVRNAQEALRAFLRERMRDLRA